MNTSMVGEFLGGMFEGPVQMVGSMGAPFSSKHVEACGVDVAEEIAGEPAAKVAGITTPKLTAKPFV